MECIAPLFLGTGGGALLLICLRFSQLEHLRLPALFVEPSVHTKVSASSRLLRYIKPLLRTCSATMLPKIVGLIKSFSL